MHWRIWKVPGRGLEWKQSSTYAACHFECYMWLCAAHVHIVFSTHSVPHTHTYTNWSKETLYLNLISNELLTPSNGECMYSWNINSDQFHLLNSISITPTGHVTADEKRRQYSQARAHPRNYRPPYWLSFDNNSFGVYMTWHTHYTYAVYSIMVCRLSNASERVYYGEREKNYDLTAQSYYTNTECTH